MKTDSPAPTTETDTTTRAPRAPGERSYGPIDAPPAPTEPPKED